MKNTTITFRISEMEKAKLQEKANNQNQSLTKLIENKLKDDDN